jgi:hypothetical protein
MLKLFWEFINQTGFAVYKIFSYRLAQFGLVLRHLGTSYNHFLQVSFLLSHLVTSYNHFL